MLRASWDCLRLFDNFHYFKLGVCFDSIRSNSLFFCFVFLFVGCSHVSLFVVNLPSFISYFQKTTINASEPENFAERHELLSVSKLVCNCVV